VLTYIAISAVSAGVSDDFSIYLVSIANAASAFGRIASGLAADRFGGRARSSAHPISRADKPVVQAQ
jgi:nitrate/nitrite transporter NarK